MSAITAIICEVTERPKFRETELDFDLPEFDTAGCVLPLDLEDLAFRLARLNFAVTAEYLGQQDELEIDAVEEFVEACEAGDNGAPFPDCLLGVPWSLKPVTSAPPGQIGCTTYEIQFEQSSTNTPPTAPIGFPQWITAMDSQMRPPAPNCDCRVTAPKPTPRELLVRKIERAERDVVGLSLRIAELETELKAAKKERKEAVEDLRQWRDDLEAGRFPLPMDDAEEADDIEPDARGDQPHPGQSPAASAAAPAASQAEAEIDPDKIPPLPMVGLAPERPQSVSQSQGEPPPSIELPPPPRAQQQRHDIAVLKLTASQTDKLAEADVRTVEDLEAMIRRGDFVPSRAPKGIGQKAIDTITDKLCAWRQANPVCGMETERDPQRPAIATISQLEQAQARERELRRIVVAVNNWGYILSANDLAFSTNAEVEACRKFADEMDATGEADEPDFLVPYRDDSYDRMDAKERVEATRKSAAPAPAAPIDPPEEINEAMQRNAYKAGCEANLQGIAVSKNPYKKGSYVYRAWDQGWQDTNNA
jgi:hypothetical protein